MKTTWRGEKLGSKFPDKKQRSNPRPNTKYLIHLELKDRIISSKITFTVSETKLQINLGEYEY